MKTRNGFTLVELLVVIGIIGILVALLLPAIQSARQASLKTKCANNMRQLGLAVLTYTETYRGRWPENSDSAAGTPSKAWIYSVARYLEDVDTIGICPNDPFGENRRLNKLTSYSLNGYLTTEAKPSFENIRKIPATSKSIIGFEASDAKGLDVEVDHVHAFEWFTPSSSDDIYKAVVADIQLDRHNNMSHYLYADGHIELIHEDEIHDWIHKKYNFAIPK